MKTSVAKKKKVTKKVVTKKKKMQVTKKVSESKKNTPTPPVLVNPFEVSLIMGEESFNVKTKTLEGAIDELKVLIPSPMLIKTRGKMIISHMGKSKELQMRTFMLKGLLHGHGDVRKIIFAKNVLLTLK